MTRDRSEYMRGYLKEWLAANPDKRRKYANTYRERHIEKVKARERAQYHKNPKRAAAATANWLSRNPDRRDFYRAKRQLAESMGVAYSLVPNDLAEAKAAQLKVYRDVRGRERP